MASENTHFCNRCGATAWAVDDVYRGQYGFTYQTHVIECKDPDCRHRYLDKNEERKIDEAQYKHVKGKLDEAMKLIARVAKIEESSFRQYAQVELIVLLDDLSGEAKRICAPKNDSPKL